MSTPQALIVGAGIVGAATARELAVRGVDVLLLDAGGVSSGTTGLGEGNVLCCDKVAGPELTLAILGLAAYDEIEQRIGAPARIRRKGALLVHPSEETWALEPERRASLAAAGVPSRAVSPEELRELEPELTGEVCGASLFGDDLQCDPRAITHALADEAARAGATVRTGARVTSIDVSASSVTGVTLDDGERLAADSVVLAAGAWSRALAQSAGLELPLEPRRGQLVQLAAPQDPRSLIAHKVVDGSYLSSVASDAGELQLSTVVETTWDGDVLVGSSRERGGFGTDADPAVGDAMVERAARLFPRLTQLPRRTAWAGLRPWLPDHLPAIGPSSAIDGLWVATGHEGAGVGQGPITGTLVAQAFVGEPTATDLTAFAVDRFTN